MGHGQLGLDRRRWGRGIALDCDDDDHLQISKASASGSSPEAAHGTKHLPVIDEDRIAWWSEGRPGGSSSNDRCYSSANSGHEEFVTTATVVEELEKTAEYDDLHGAGAAAVLDVEDALTVVDIEGNQFKTSRIDVGEAGCVAAARELDAAFFVTDDCRALAELQEIVDTEVALSPIVLRALVKRGVLTEAEAQSRFEMIAEDRDWLGAPIYRYAHQLLD